MKLFIVVILLMGIFNQTNAQNDTLSSFKVKAGVYNTFRDIRDTNPLSLTDFKIVKRKNGTGKLEIVSLSKAKMDVFQKTLVGVSDGNEFYISGRFTFAGYLGLVKCYLRGPYIFAQENPPNYFGLLGAVVTVGVDYSGRGYVIDINKGLSLLLNKKFIKNLLSKYPDLEQEYKLKMNLMDHALEILQKVNEKENAHN